MSSFVRVPALLCMALFFSSVSAAAVETMSGDQAREAAQKLTGGSSSPAEAEQVPPAAQAPVVPAETPEPPVEQAPVVPVPEPAPAVSKEPADYTDKELGPVPDKSRVAAMIDSVRGTDTMFDAEKIEALRRKVQQQIDSSSPEEKARLLKLQSQVNEMVQTMIQKAKQLEPAGAKKDEKK